ncbi:CHAT domain-containing protein [Mycena epipterygia]|nr:CHAT domain-containing protein [Mycena epipterygia]
MDGSLNPRGSDTVAICQEKLDRCPTWGVHRCDRLRDLAIALFNRFKSMGVVNDIELAITYQREAISLLPIWNPQHVSCLENLAIILSIRFQHLGQIKDLEEAIEIHRKTVALLPVGHPDRASSLNNLAVGTHHWFDQQGNMEDIDEVVRLTRDALTLCSTSHPGRASWLSNLASAIHHRFDKRGNVEDIDEAIQLHREALALQSATQPDRAHCLNNLAVAVKERFGQGGNAEDIDEAAQLLREAHILLPAPHPNRATCLGNLAAVVHEQFEKLGNIEAIDEAIQLYRDTLALRLPPNPDRAGSLNNLAVALVHQFQQQGNVEDIDEAIQLHQEAIVLWPAPHSGRASCLGSLGTCLLESHAHAPDSIALSDAILAYQEAMYSSISPLDQFKAAKAWAMTADKYHHSSAIQAYSTVIGLLPQLAAFDRDLQSRQTILISHSDNLGSNAAALAIDLGQYKVAIELLEAARSIFWAQSLHLRTSLDDVQHAHPDLAAKFTELSQKLEQSSFRDTSRDLKFDSHQRVMSMEAEALKCQKLNNEWIQTVESVRSSVPGFEDFMRPKSMAKLRLAAQRGPVVVLNAGRSSCHALIVGFSGNVQCVLLPEVTREVVSALAAIIQSISSGTFISIFHTLSSRGFEPNSTDRLIGKLEDKKTDNPEAWFRVVLHILWINVVNPVIQYLKLEKSEKPPRLWWCPTGPFAFLPIHAAGIYNEEPLNECVADYVISSYTPTLAALLSPPYPTYSTNNPLQVTAVIQPNTPGFSDLPYTEDELQKLKENIPQAWLTNLGTSDSPASVKKVLQYLQNSSIIHFACHGVQDTAKPLQSALLIDSDRLTVSQIMEKSGFLHDGPENSEKDMGLAFLSACQTATGNQQLPDEAMHLAASLLFAGFRSVVATMWTIQDPDGPDVAEVFYGHLFRNADPTSNPPVFPDLNESAEALHLAVAKLKTKVPLLRWVPFVHYGV